MKYVCHGKRPPKTIRKLPKANDINAIVFDGLIIRNGRERTIMKLAITLVIKPVFPILFNIIIQFLFGIYS